MYKGHVLVVPKVAVIYRFDCMYGIVVDKLGFHFYMLGYEIFERLLLACNFGMCLFASLVYNKDCLVLTGMVSNVLLVFVVW